VLHATHDVWVNFACTGAPVCSAPSNLSKPVVLWPVGRQVIHHHIASSNNVRLCDNSNPDDRRFVPELRAGRSSGDGILYYCSLLSVNRWRASSVVSSSGQLTKHFCPGGSVAEWAACWTQAQKSLGSNRSRDTVG